MDIFWNAIERRLRTLWRLIALAIIMVALGATPILLIDEPLAWLDGPCRVPPGETSAGSVTASHSDLSAIVQNAILKAIPHAD